MVRDEGGDSVPFLEYCESVRMMRVFVLGGTVSKTRAMAYTMSVYTLRRSHKVWLRAYE
jgi:hypothetical protein